LSKRPKEAVATPNRRFLTSADEITGDMFDSLGVDAPPPAAPYDIGIYLNSVARRHMNVIPGPLVFSSPGQGRRGARPDASRMGFPYSTDVTGR
jgi:hypothetical protein